MTELLERLATNASLDEQMWIMLTVFGITFIARAFFYASVNVVELKRSNRNGAALEIAWDRWHNRLAMLLTHLFLIMLGVIVGLSPQVNPPTTRGTILRFVSVSLAFYLTLNAQRSEHARQRLQDMRDPDGHKE